MSQLIVTSRYLKSGNQKNKTKRRNYTKYIATRETVEIRSQKFVDRNANATKNQEKLINDLINDFPESKRYLEYEDYERKPTIENAGKLISTIVERNADVVGNRQNFVGYMAMRPGVEKRGSHGLFNERDEPIILNQAANEIAEHKGNVWSHVVSLRREDAVRLGFDNSDAWRELVKRHISNIAKTQNIPLCNLKWYAAYHDTTHHPHIHLLVYSTNPKQGFLTKAGIDKIRSAFANDIFHDDLQSIYQEQTVSRDELKAVSKNEFESIVNMIASNEHTDPQLEELIRKLYIQLQNVKGKKVYGYLPMEIKETVNKIFSELAKDENIQQLYEKWCGLERLKYKTYTLKETELPELSANKVFQPVRNMIIRTVLNMKPFDANTEIEGSEPNDEYIDNTPQNVSPLFDEAEPLAETETDESATAIKYYIKWADQYKKACKLIYGKDAKLNDFKKAEQLLLSESQRGNVLAVYDLGKLYSTDKLGERNEETSIAKYTRALQGFLQIEPNSKKLKPYVQYRIGKMFCYGLGTEQDYEKAFEWFERSAKQKNKFAQFSLANLYYYGSGVEKDLSQAFLWYQRSSSQGQPYAAYSIAQMYRYGEYVTKDNDTAQRYYKQALSGFLKIESDDMANDDLFYKLGQMFKFGLGTDSDVTKAIEYFRRSAEMNNKNGLFEYGKALLIGEHIPQDTDSALKILEKAVKLKNSNAKRFLALEYISGEHLEQDFEKGIALLTECADSGDVIACYRLGKIYLESEIMPQNLDKAEKYLLLAEDNEYTQYALAKLYLQEEKYDIQKAVNYFEKSADKNHWASYQLGRIYLFGAKDIERDKEQAIEWFTKSANDGNEYAQAILDEISKFENDLLANTIFSLFVSLSRCIQDSYDNDRKDLQSIVDRKLMRVIRRKKMELGEKEENHMDIQ
ncbi:MobP3 family relaxase [Ruminococcus bicirculans (ex Wegman et al. 2014)]|uniref:Relaxase MobL n=1 Tax=Ruminococcus bicirculans (ex Wegman et al. 2014) TaxID=1160721 RepID=A0AAW6E820_9FIRM|nr:MobP3 family relaxase [Ruminococcus bicirculans (ex Wegman et al. 2014)]MDB8736781.1 relaxase MobL [Ruminococcus bicirculans (ex Wegman et al. 2014)]MDB8743047.1 relaxase MobL [Ruminococcus bicirculans (ex Wegman et al. 2014)]